jgi:hypothetical protein
MATFQVKFQRYRNLQSRISGTQFINTNNGDFNEAAEIANTMLRGMRAADPESEYRIVSLLSHDYRGEDCEGGGRMFETQEEFTARVAEKG